jgi:hypothetical protein
VAEIRVSDVSRLEPFEIHWPDGLEPFEGVEADDYPVSRSLLSRLRRAGRALARTREQVPAGYESFPIVQHARELDAPYSPSCLAVKLRDDDLPGWALRAVCGRLIQSGPRARP